MKDVLTAIYDYYLLKWTDQLDILNRNPGNQIAEHWRKIYFAKYLIAEQALKEYENGTSIDLNDIAKRLDVKSE